MERKRHVDPRIGRRIREVRRARGVPVEKLAGAMAISPRGFLYIEQGQRDITLKCLTTIAPLLQCSVATLLQPVGSRIPRRQMAGDTLRRDVLHRYRLKLRDVLNRASARPGYVDPFASRPSAAQRVAP